MCFRVSHPDVVLENLWPLGRHHEAAVEEASKRTACSAKSVERRLDDGIDDRGARVVAQDRRVAVGTHAAGVRSFIVVENGLVILRGRIDEVVVTVAEDDEADLFTLQELLEYDAAAGVTDELSRQHGLRGFAGFLLALGQHDALARGEAVCFQRNGETEAADVLVDVAGVFKKREIGSGNAVLPHELFGKELAAFQLGGELRRTYNRKLSHRERIHEPVRQWRFRADDREVGT